MMQAAAQLMLEKAREVPAEGPVPSPCISVCRMDAASGLCEGCFRTLDEIAAWGMLDARERRAIWRSIALRAQPEGPA